ncbi:MAG: CvpA family protein [Bacilli bacterium]|nr:CvpA family protein [Bacilli bacterium]
MNIIDIIIILMIILGGLIGWKKGFFKQTVSTIGTIIVFILAFYLKNPLAEFISLLLPFFDFGGIFKGITALNIILYQLISFVIILTILTVILNVIIKVTGIVEKILKFTIILGIPSKILGFFVGLIEAYVIIFIVLFFASQPAFNFQPLNESKITPKILESTPILSNIAGEMVNTVNDLYSLGDKYVSETDSNAFNKEAIDIMLKHKIITVNYVEKLIDKNKINIVGIDSVLNKYR